MTIPREILLQLEQQAARRYVSPVVRRPHPTSR
jgi:hypothetical protein